MSHIGHMYASAATGSRAGHSGRALRSGRRRPSAHSLAMAAQELRQEQERLQVGYLPKTLNPNP